MLLELDMWIFAVLSWICGYLWFRVGYVDICAFRVGYVNICAFRVGYVDICEFRVEYVDICAFKIWICGYLCV